LNRGLAGHNRFHDWCAKLPGRNSDEKLVACLIRSPSSWIPSLL
jgi:hypothetical protein